MITKNTIQQSIKLRQLRQDYNVVGGECTIEEEKQLQEIMDYQNMKTKNKALRYNRPMFRIYYDDNEDSELPAFMINLWDGHVATCYTYKD
jgi:hypothetical protein